MGRAEHGPGKAPSSLFHLAAGAVAQVKKVLFSGGGTGGHIYPALAMYELLQEKLGAGNLQGAYAGLAGGMEAGIVSRIPNLPFLPVRGQGMPRELSVRWLTFPFRNVLGGVDAWKHLRQFRPDLVITTGGYVAFPVLLASRLLGIPYAMHEQNAAMGVTNSVFASAASRVLLTYEEAFSERSVRVSVTGNPVRKAFVQRKTSENSFQKKDGQFWILFVGGSRGAASLNKSCLELSREWLSRNPQVVLLHITGERDFEKVKAEAGSPNERHILLPYLHEMREAFAVADLLVSRAGATILAEIACESRPAILVPYPFATDNHQEKNARILEQSGAARVILDKDLSGASLASVIEAVQCSGTLEKMTQAMSASRPADVEERIWQSISPLLT